MYSGDFPYRPRPLYILQRQLLFAAVATAMKNPQEVLRRKEAELERIQEEVEALRLVGKLLSERSAGTLQEPANRGKILQMP